MWTLAFIETEFEDTTSKDWLVKLQLMRETIASLKAAMIDLDAVWWWRRADNSTPADLDVQIGIIPANVGNSITLMIAKLLANSNLILLQNRWGFMGNDLTLDSINIQIQSRNRSEANSTELVIMDRFKLSTVVCPTAIIIPSNALNTSFIELAYTISAGLQTPNDNFATTLSLSVAKLKTGIMFSSLHVPLVTIDDPSLYASLNEKLMIGNSIEASELIPYDHPDYIYLPRFDLNAESEPWNHPYAIMDSRAKNELLAADNNLLTSTAFGAVNTNAFTYPVVAYSQLYKRWSNPAFGVFIRKPRGRPVIPKIVHHFWLDSAPNPNYCNLWARSFREPWSYMVWTTDLIASEFGDKQWWKWFTEHTNPNLKLLLAYLAVLEEWGGVAISAASQPMRLIPDSMLTSSYVSIIEPDLMLSHRFMAAVPGVTLHQDKRRATDAARRPYIGANNWFIQTKLANDAKMGKTITDNEQIADASLYNDMRQIFRLGIDSKEAAIRDAMLNNAGMMLYPSYYIDPKKESNKLQRLAIMRNIEADKANKTDTSAVKAIERSSIVTPQAIVARLTENPLNRIRNRRG